MVTPDALEIPMPWDFDDKQRERLTEALSDITSVASYHELNLEEETTLILLHIYFFLSKLYYYVPQDSTVDKPIELINQYLDIYAEDIKKSGKKLKKN